MLLSPQVWAQSAEDLTLQGDSKMEEGNILGAIKDYTSAIDIDESYALAFLGRGSLYAELEEFEDALSDLNTAITLDESLEEVHFNKAYIYIKRGELSGALLEYNAYIASNPNDASGYLARAELYVMLDQLVDARESYNSFIEKSGDLFEDQIAKAEVHLKLGDTTASLMSIEKCLEMQPENFRLFAMRGLLFSEMKQWQKSLADYSTAIVLSEQSDYYVARADIYGQMGEFDFAVEDIAAAIQLQPSHSEYFFLKGYYQIANKEFNPALKSLIEAKEMGFETNGEFYYNLGLAQYNTGDQIGACDSWSRSQGQAYELTQKYCTAD